MKWLKLTLSLAVMVPPLALIGAFTTLDSGESLWVGLTIGSVVGAFFGLVFGGRFPRKWADVFFGKEKSMPDDDLERERLLVEAEELLAQLKALPPFDPSTPPEKTGNPKKDRLFLEAWTLACRLFRLLQAMPTLPDNLACVVLAQVDQISARAEEIDRELKALADDAR